MDRANVIVQQLGMEVDSKYDESLKGLQMLMQFLQQYKSVVDDLVQSKKNYGEVVIKYSQNSGDGMSNVGTFPGIAPSAPQYSNSEMSMDSKQLNELASLISEMEDQRELIQTQIQRLMKGLTTNVATMTDTASQIMVFLSQSIDDMSSNGIYGSPDLNEVNV